jgi:hypothetical protein
VPRGLKWLLVGCLIGGLLMAGVYDEAIFAVLTRLWQGLLGAFGLGEQATALQQSMHQSVAKRFLPALVTYAGLYLLTCLVILRLLLPPAKWRLALVFYAAVGAAYVALVVVGKLAGNAVWAYRLGRHLLDFVVSPLPIAALLVLFRAGLGQPSAEQHTP